MHKWTVYLYSCHKFLYQKVSHSKWDKWISSRKNANKKLYLVYAIFQY